MDVNIVSDWDSKFTSTFLESFRRKLGQRSTGIQIIISIQIVSQRELFRLRGHAQELRLTVGWKIGKHYI